MAKKKKKEYGAGKTSAEIIKGVSRNIGRVTESTLRSAVTRLSSAMNKRLDRAAKTGQETPAMKEARESGGRFSARGKDKEGLKAEFLRIKNFFENPTSTVKGWAQIVKEATKKATKKGLLNPPPVPPEGAPPTPPTPPGGGVSGAEWEEPPMPPTPGEEEAPPRWSPPSGWEYDEESRSWSHPEYGKGWLPFEGPGGGFEDPVTGEVVGNSIRSFHDYDAVSDLRRYGKGTETGEIWRMVDDIAKLDPRFSDRGDSDPDRDPRIKLFNAIDDTWVANEGITFAEARDMVVNRLDEIYKSAAVFWETSSNVGFAPSTYTTEDDDWY